MSTLNNALKPTVTIAFSKMLIHLDQVVCEERVSKKGRKRTSARWKSRVGRKGGSRAVNQEEECARVGWEAE